MVIVTRGLSQTSIDNTPVSANVEKALKGLVAPMDLAGDEQEQYFDRVESLLSGPSPQSDTFFKNMRQNIGGVGMDEAGNIINFEPTKASLP